MRTGKELLLATRPFAEELPGTSWRSLLVTLAALVAALAGAALLPGWPLRIGASLAGGLLMVRAFIFFHDYEHGAILRGSAAAKALLHALGLLLLVPPRSWRESHNYHHANVAKLDVPAVGSFPVMSASKWRRSTARQRFAYRASRHPLTILFAGVTVFWLNITLVPFVRSPRRYWDSGLAMVAQGGLIAALALWGGPSAALLGFVVPYGLATAVGAYFFYAQHNYPGVHMVPAAEWTYYRAALESSSYLRTGRVLRWLTGDIGYHHVHHLNPAIPFYRLAEAMAAIPELQKRADTSLRPRDVAACFRGNVWDERTAAMISYRAASASNERARQDSNLLPSDSKSDALSR